LKNDTIWNVIPCSLICVKRFHRKVIKEVSLFKILVHFTRLHGTTLQITAIFMVGHCHENLNIMYFALFNYSVSNVIM